MCNWVPFYYIFKERDGCITSVNRKEKKGSSIRNKEKEKMGKWARECAGGSAFSVCYGPGQVMPLPQAIHAWVASWEPPVCDPPASSSLRRAEC